MSNIVSTANEATRFRHRSDFITCRDCDHKMKSDEWKAAAVMLVLEPQIFKQGHVVVVSECPKCFEFSWIHVDIYRFDCFEYYPDGWLEAVNKKQFNYDT